MKTILITLDEKGKSKLDTEDLSKFEIIGLLDAHLSFFKEAVIKEGLQKTNLPTKD